MYQSENIRQFKFTQSLTFENESSLVEFGVSFLNLFPFACMTFIKQNASKLVEVQYEKIQVYFLKKKQNDATLGNIQLHWSNSSLDALLALLVLCAWLAEADKKQLNI